VTSVQWSELRKAAEESGFSTCPAGEYDCVIESSTPTESSSGKTMFKIRLKIETGPHAGSPVLTNWVLSTDNGVALGFFFRKMSAIGLDNAYFDKDPSIEQVAKDMEHRRCVAEITVREWNGQERNDVNTLKPPTDGNFVRPSGPDPGSDLGVFGSFDQAAPPATVPPAPAAPGGMPF
jgi:Protein of unknown function (DUF669)